MIVEGVTEVGEPPKKKNMFWRLEAKRERSLTSHQVGRSLYEEWMAIQFSSSVPTVNDMSPGLRNVYIDFNTSLPSSAPVERLFSLSKRVLSPTRTLLSDKNFEMLVMLAASCTGKK